MSRYSIFFITVEKRSDAENITRKLVEERLAACVNIVPGIESYFRWKGKIDHAGELLLMAKSSHDMAEKLIERVKELHPYEVPEIIELPIKGGSSDYLRWIEESLGN